MEMPGNEKELLSSVKLRDLTGPPKTLARSILLGLDSVNPSSSKLNSLYSLVKLSKTLSKRKPKDSEIKGQVEELLALCAQRGVYTHRKELLPEEPRAKSRKRTPRTSRQIESLESMPLLKHFSEGTLPKYLKSAQAKKELGKIAKDPALFQQYAGALFSLKSPRDFAQFLTTKEGINCFVEIGKTEPGLVSLVKIGQTPQGRKVAQHMIASPFRGWPAMFRILKRLGSHRGKYEEYTGEFPPFQLSQFSGAKDPKPFLDAMSGPNAEALFTSFSESKQNAKLCGRLLENDEIRHSVFNFITQDTKRAFEIFSKLFTLPERRKNSQQIFRSDGGSRLLTELASDLNGRSLLVSLAITDQGREMGIRMLLRSPILIIKVGRAYFKEPKTAS